MPMVLHWTDAAVDVALELDVALREGYERTAELSEHAVETGEAIADHVRPVGATITIEGLISNTPVRIPSTQMGGAAPVGTRLEVTVGGRKIALATRGWTAPFDRVRDCDRLLAALVETGQLVRVTSGLTTVDNLVVIRYRVDRDAATGDALPVTLDLKRVRLASTRRVAVPAVRRIQPVQARGAQPPTDRRTALRRIGQSGENQLRGLAARLGL